MGNPALFLPSSKVRLFLACPYFTSSLSCTFLLFLFLVAPRFHFFALSCSAAFCQVSRAQPSVNELLILHFTLILQIVSFVILCPFCNFMLPYCVTLVRTVLIHVNVLRTVAWSMRHVASSVKSEEKMPEKLGKSVEISCRLVGKFTTSKDLQGGW